MKYKLSEIAEIKSGGTPSTKDSAYWNGKIPWITPKDLSTYKKRYISKGERNITDQGLNNSSTVVLPENTILFTSRAPIGYVAIAENKLCTNQGFKSLVCDDSKCYFLYLYYWILNNVEYIKSQANGSTFQEVSGSVMKNIEIYLPGISIQKKVAEILDCIDKKIELNNQINYNLIEILKLKFNNWINNLTDYNITNLSCIANYKNGLAMQKFRPVNEEGLPVIKIKEMNSGLSNDTERCSSNIDKDVIIEDGDVLFAWSGTLCMTIWCNGKAGLNQHIFKVTSEKYPKWFYYFWTMKHLDKFIQIAAGKATTMGHIKRSELDNAEVLLPDHNEILKMDKIMAPILEKYIENLKENKRLEQLRDTLLPKLMNGEIDLEKIKI